MTNQEDDGAQKGAYAVYQAAVDAANARCEAAVLEAKAALDENPDVKAAWAAYRLVKNAALDVYDAARNAAQRAYEAAVDEAWAILMASPGPKDSWQLYRAAEREAWAAFEASAAEHRQGGQEDD